MEEALIKRLELAVARLERAEGSITQRPTLAPKPGQSVQNTNNDDIPQGIKQYDEAIKAPLDSFIALCEKIGGDVAEIGNKFKVSFDVHRRLLWTAAGQPEPEDATALQNKFTPLMQKMQEANEFKEAKRQSPNFNHLAAIAEGLQALTWVAIKPAPAPYVKEMLDAALFYINRVRTGNKDQPVHQDWAKNFLEIFNALQKFIKQVHTTGLVWNSAPGATPPGENNTKPAASRAGPGGPPAPPPPPPPGFADAKKTTSGGSDTDRQALFAELNKGEAITSGLKKVTAEMQTHKNPGLRAGSTVPDKKTSPSSAKTAEKPKVVDRPPKTELKDHKVWNVEYHKGGDVIKLETDKKQAVYIFKCENTLVQIRGKVNSVTLDSCKKTNVEFENLLAQVEVINCQSVKVQTLGSLPTISIQKTDGCQVYLSKDSLDAEIVTSKSSEMNLLVPTGDGGDFVEYPIPEQFKTTFAKESNKIVTVVSDIV